MKEFLQLLNEVEDVSAEELAKVKALKWNKVHSSSSSNR